MKRFSWKNFVCKIFKMLSIKFSIDSKVYFWKHGKYISWLLQICWDSVFQVNEHDSQNIILQLLHLCFGKLFKQNLLRFLWEFGTESGWIRRANLFWLQIEYLLLYLINFTKCPIMPFLVDCSYFYMFLYTTLIYRNSA